MHLRWTAMGWLSKRTRTSLDLGAHSTDAQIWANENRLQTIPDALPSSSDVYVLLLNQPIVLSRTRKGKLVEFIVTGKSVECLEEYGAHLWTPHHCIWFCRDTKRYAFESVWKEDFKEFSACKLLCKTFKWGRTIRSLHRTSRLHRTYQRRCLISRATCFICWWKTFHLEYQECILWSTNVALLKQCHSPLPWRIV